MGVDPYGWGYFGDLDSPDAPDDPPPTMSDIAYLPTVADVAALILSRTNDRDGNSTGTFTTTTRPTAAQVTALIGKAMDKLLPKFGPTVPDELVGSAKEIVELRSAMLVELTYFADQIRGDRSPYATLLDLYTQGLQDFIVDRKQLGADATAGTTDDLSTAGLPAYSFPPSSGCDRVIW